MLARKKHTKKIRSFLIRMKRLIQLHKDIMNDMAFRFNLTAYQITWIAWAKGLVFGYAICYFAGA